MKYRLASLAPIQRYAAVIALASVVMGVLVALGYYSIAAILLPVVVWGINRIGRQYSEATQRATYMFNALDCDDFTFQFRENTASVDDKLLNASLNRIRRIMEQARRRAHERERFYQIIMERTGIGVVTLNDNGSVLNANTATLRTFGVRVLTHARQLSAAYPEACDILLHIQHGERRHADFRNESGEQHLCFECTSFTLSGKLLRIVSVSELNREMSDMQLDSWSRLTRILTHEIMNSLAPITSLSDALSRRNTDPEVAEGLDVIAATSRRLGDFVENFRRYTRIPDPVKSPFEIAKLIDEAVILTGRRAHIALERRITPPDVMIYADRTQIGQVIVNLLKNAVEAIGSRPDGRIAIHVRIDSEENVIVEVANNGGQIPRDIAQHIFTPFFTTKQGGSGIGLSISQRIMQLHNGSLALTANNPDRTAFTLVFR